VGWSWEKGGFVVLLIRLILMGKSKKLGLEFFTINKKIGILQNIMMVIIICEGTFSYQ